MNTFVPAALLQYMAGLKEHDLENIGSSLSEGVQFITPVTTMGKSKVLKFLAALYVGFPDWHYSHSEPELLEDGSFAVFWRQGGTHTGRLDFPGFEPVAATGKLVNIPAHYFFYKVSAAGLTEIRPDPVPGGAPRGIFEQIGVELPPV